jgi:hypothetical protein
MLRTSASGASAPALPVPGWSRISRGGLDRGPVKDRPAAASLGSPVRRRAHRAVLSGHGGRLRRPSVALLARSCAGCLATGLLQRAPREFARVRREDESQLAQRLLRHERRCGIPDFLSGSGPHKRLRVGAAFSHAGSQPESHGLGRSQPPKAEQLASQRRCPCPHPPIISAAAAAHARP